MFFIIVLSRFYGPAQMKAESRTEFEKWYYANKDNQFDFQKELEYYCHLDVDILTKGCLRFREILMKVRFSIAYDIILETLFVCL